MKLKNSFLRLCVCTAMFSLPTVTMAQDGDTIYEQNANRIEFDQESNAGIIYINNRPTLLITESGLSVVGDIDYGGSITDVGSDIVRMQIESLEDGHGHEQ